MIHARDRTCLVMLRVIGPGDGDVMTSVEISNVCQIQFYLHPTSTATHSAAHFPMEGSCCFLLPSNYQHLVETLKKVEIINCNSTNFISVVPFAMKSVAEAHFLPLLRFILFNFTSCPQRLNSTVNTIQPFIGKSMMVCV